MILGEMEYHVSPQVYEANRERSRRDGTRRRRVENDDVDIYALTNEAHEPGQASCNLSEEQIEKRQGKTSS